MGILDLARNRSKPGSTVNSTTNAPAASVYSDLDMQEKAASLGLSERDMATLDPGMLMEAAYTQDQLGNMPEYQGTTAGQYASAKQTLANTPIPSGSLLRPLEDALRTKENIGQQEMGESTLYDKAGLTGYAVLSQSLNERSREMDDKYRSFASMMETTAGGIGDAYNQTLNTYQMLKGEYDTQMEQFNGTLERIQDAEDAMAMLEKEQAYDKEMYEWKKQTDAKYAGNSEGDPSSFDEWNGMDYSSNWNDEQTTNQLSQLFQLEGQSKYRSSGWECAEGSNKITTGHLGSAYSDKMSKVVKQDNPQMGNQMVIPYGPAEYGHAATVLQYDPSTGAIFTQEWNHNGDGAMTFETYNMNDLNEQYGSNWGFTDSTLKPEYQDQAMQALQGRGGQVQVPQNIQTAADYGDLGPAVKTTLESAMPHVAAVLRMASPAAKKLIEDNQAIIEASSASEPDKQSVSQLNAQIIMQVENQMPDASSASKTNQIKALLIEAGIDPKTMTYTDSEETESSGGSSLGINLDDYK